MHPRTPKMSRPGAVYSGRRGTSTPKFGRACLVASKHCLGSLPASVVGSEVGVGVRLLRERPALRRHVDAAVPRVGDIGRCRTTDAVSAEVQVVGGGRHVDLLRGRAAQVVHHVRLVVAVGRLVEQDVLLVLELVVLVHVLQRYQQRRVDEITQADADVQPRVPDLVDDAAGDHRAEGVRQRVGDVGDGVHAAVDGHVADIDEVAEGRKDGRVDERDAEAVDHNREDDGDVFGAEGDDETAQSLETQPDEGDEPLVGGEHGDELDGQIDAEDVREEGGQPDHADLPLGRVHRVGHPQRDGWLEEGERDVGHHQRAGAHGDVRVDDEAVDGRAAGEVLLVHRPLLARRPHHEHDEDAVDEGGEGEE